MVSYKVLALIQAILIIICGFSVLDLGTNSAAGGDLGFNDFLFDSTSGLPSMLSFLDANDFWNVFAFWGYLMMLVGVLQFIKAFSSSGP